MNAADDLRPYAGRIAVAAPLLANALFWYWVIRDDPPLQAFVFGVCCALVLVTVGAGAVFLSDRGMHPLIALLLAIMLTPVMLVATSFLLIAASLFLGGLAGELF